MAIEFGAFGPGRPLVLIAGPCVIESEEHVCRMARGIRDALGGDFVFKASFDKANRTSLDAYRGPGLVEGLRILARLKAEGFSILTDIHEAAQAVPVAEVADILQIPAFLCRQTDLLLAAGRTGRIVNIKKGQFVAPHDIHRAAEKVASTGNSQVILTERGLFVRIQQPGGGYARAQDHARCRLAGGLRRHPQRAAAGRRWRRFGRPAAVHRAAGARCGGGGRGWRFRGSPRRAGEGALGRAERPACRACWRDSGAGCRLSTGW